MGTNRMLDVEVKVLVDGHLVARLARPGPLAQDA